jgi:hypothetical protein
MGQLGACPTMWKHWMVAPSSHPTDALRWGRAPCDLHESMVYEVDIAGWHRVAFVVLLPVCLSGRGRMGPGGSTRLYGVSMPGPQ